MERNHENKNVKKTEWRVLPVHDAALGITGTGADDGVRVVEILS